MQLKSTNSDRWLSHVNNRRWVLTVRVRSFMSISLSLLWSVLDFEVDVAIALLNLLVQDLPNHLSSDVVAKVFHRIGTVRLYMIISSAGLENMFPKFSCEAVQINPRGKRGRSRLRMLLGRSPPGQQPMIVLQVWGLNYGYQRTQKTEIKRRRWSPLWSLSCHKPRQSCIGTICFLWLCLDFESQLYYEFQRRCEEV